MTDFLKFRSMLLCGTAMFALATAGAALAEETAFANAGDTTEVIVTGTKRAEPARKIAGSVSQTTGAQLDAIGAQSFADYLTRTPGVYFSPSIPGLSTVSIRGVSTTTAIDQGQGTTGMYINDVPLTDPYFAIAVADIDTFDVNNVTVLRGPQGTLFGSGALGGAINYQAATPDLSHFEARVQAGYRSTADGGSAPSGKVMINVPLIEGKLAVRGVLIDREDPGYVDNVGLNAKDSNAGHVQGGRFLATYKPTEGTTISYMYLGQLQKTQDDPGEDPAIGRFERSTLLPSPYHFTTDINTLRLDQDLGFATLTATATEHEKTQVWTSDYTSYFSALIGGASPVTSSQIAFSKGTTFETRLTSKPGGKFDYIVGLFYDRTAENFLDEFSAPGAAAAIETAWGTTYGAGIGEQGTTNDGTTFYTAKLPFVGKEAAFFGEVTYSFSPQLKALVGWRAFETKAQNTSAVSGFFELLAGGTLNSVLEGKQSESGVLPKVSLTWTPNSDLMVYGLISKGFRFGGPNINPSTPTDPIPATFASDSTINYEVGVRSSWFDKRLQLDSTAFFIDWSDIQLRLGTSTGLAYAANAGKAKNYGLETSLLARPMGGLVLQANVTYLDATLSEDFDSGSTVFTKGTVLPGAAKWTVSDSVSYVWSSVPLQPSIMVTHTGVSRATSSLTYGGEQGDYNLFGLRGNLQIKDNITLTAYVDNATNARAVTNYQAYPGSPVSIYYVRPRTVGLTVDYKY
jgi:iron complex outermembrane receptor protein